MEPSADVDYVNILMLLVVVPVEEKETITKPLKKKKTLITSNKFETTVHDSGCHYPIKISAPHNKCNEVDALKNTVVCRQKHTNFWCVSFL